VDPPLQKIKENDRERNSYIAHCNKPLIKEENNSHEEEEYSKAFQA
jgi:hypothetical protein